MSAELIDTEQQVAYRSKQVCALVGCTYRQLDFWVRQGYVCPSISEARGSGTQRLWSAEDIQTVRLVHAASLFVNGSLGKVLDRLAEFQP